MILLNNGNVKKRGPSPADLEDRNATGKYGDGVMLSISTSPIFNSNDCLLVFSNNDEAKFTSVSVIRRKEFQFFYDRLLKFLSSSNKLKTSCSYY